MARANLKLSFLCILRDFPVWTKTDAHSSICMIKSPNVFGGFLYIDTVLEKVMNWYFTFLGIPSVYPYYIQGLFVSELLLTFLFYIVFSIRDTSLSPYWRWLLMHSRCFELFAGDKQSGNCCAILYDRLKFICG